MVDIFVPIRVSTAQIYAFILDYVASEEDFISSARIRETSDGLTEGLDAVSRSGGSAVFPRWDVLPSAESPLRYLFSSSGFTRFHNSYAWPAPSVDL